MNATRNRMILLAGLILLVLSGSRLRGQGLEVQLLGCDSLPLLYANNGFRLVPLQRARELEPNRYAFDLSAGPPRFLYLGSSPTEYTPVIVGGSATPLLQGHCLNLEAAKAFRSPLNQQFRRYQGELRALRERLPGLLTALAQASGEAERATQLDRVRALDEEKAALWRSAAAAHPLLGAYVGMFTYLGHPGLEDDDPDVEAAYFAEHYFDQAALDDPIYNRIPQLAEAFAEYTQTLVKLPLSDARRQAYLEEALGAIPAGRPARRLAYAGVLRSLRASAFRLHDHFIGRLLAEFPQLPEALQARLRREQDQARALAVGGQAPEFQQPDPEGETVSLSALRGKVIFVDFWASWCRPCRVENPRLRQLYAGYRDRGFEVVGISLDVERASWVKAIADDQINWLHGSDLRGWDNAAAQSYRVSAIPHNVLIGRDGRILARNLSMEELEGRLEGVF